MTSQNAQTAQAEANAIVEEFGFFDDWEDRYQLLIDQGRKLAPFPGHLRDDLHRLHGCQSVVYFSAERDESDVVTFKAESDAAIVQGLVALLLRVYNNRSSSEILSTSIEFISQIGLNEHLSVTRKNGLSSMVSAIKNAAKV